MKHIQTTLLLGALIVGMPLLPLLAQNTGKAPAASPAVMGAMMDTCQKSCDAMAGTMADLTKTIDAAKASNDVAKLHEALDQVQTATAKMLAQARDCDAMMQHMQQMMPMSGSSSH
jgi:hypothetical protein